jgi:inhibitor of KinA sporulation pathway (predicted exonuclease)
MHNERCYNLTEALRITGIDYEEGEHDALVDAKNTALLFAKMEREQELKLSKYYTDQKNEHLTSNPFADLFAMFEIAV